MNISRLAAVALLLTGCRAIHDDPCMGVGPDRIATMGTGEVAEFEPFSPGDPIAVETMENGKWGVRITATVEGLDTTEDATLFLDLISPIFGEYTATTPTELSCNTGGVGFVAMATSLPSDAQSDEALDALHLSTLRLELLVQDHELTEATDSIELQMIVE